MRRHSLVARSTRIRAIAALATVLFSACRTQERGPDSTGGPPPAAALPGELTKPIDQYTGDEFHALVQRLPWAGGVDRERKCRGDATCEGTTPTRRTMVRVDAVNGQDSISATSVAANGVVTIRAINRGTIDEDRYGLKANRRLEYYLIVLPGDAAAGRWRLEELDTTPGARKHASVGTGTFRPCNHPFRAKRVNRANFFTCADSHLSDSVQTSGLALFAVATDPMWTDCAQGCCLADG